MNWTIISNEEEYDKAIERLELIFDAQPNDPEFKEAKLLTMLIENYEMTTELEFPNPDPIEVIKFKMEQKGMRSKDLADILGGKSKASEILNRKRRLTLNMIRQINKFLGIPAQILITEYELTH